MSRVKYRSDVTLVLIIASLIFLVWMGCFFFEDDDINYDPNVIYSEPQGDPVGVTYMNGKFYCRDAQERLWESKGQCD